MSVIMASREATAAAVGPAAARLLAEKEVLPSVVCGVKRGFGVGRAIVEVDERRGEMGEEMSSGSSSSIGEADEEESSLSTSSAVGRGGEEAEVQSQWSKEASLGSLDSLEEALPIKRGLSSFFSGKSKSFASLADASAATSVRDLAKPENPFNKRRRILVTCSPSWKRRASYASLPCSSNSASGLSSPSVTVAASTPPELSFQYLESEDGKQSEGCFSPTQSPALLRFHKGSSDKQLLGNMAFRSARSFSLSDLRHHARKQ